MRSRRANTRVRRDPICFIELFTNEGELMRAATHLSHANANQRRRATTPCCCAALERRVLLSAAVVGGVLMIDGTGVNDVITVMPQGTSLRVRINRSSVRFPAARVNS